MVASAYGPSVDGRRGGPRRRPLLSDDPGVSAPGKGPTLRPLPRLERNRGLRRLCLGIIERRLLRTLSLHGALTIGAAWILYASARSLEAAAIGRDEPFSASLTALPTLLTLAVPVASASAVSVSAGSGVAQALESAGVHPAVWIRPLSLWAVAMSLLATLLINGVAPYFSQPVDRTSEWLILEDWLMRRVDHNRIELLHVEEGRLTAFGVGPPPRYAHERYVFERMTWKTSPGRSDTQILRGPSPKALRLARKPPRALRPSELQAAASACSVLGKSRAPYRSQRTSRVLRAVAVGLLSLVGGVLVLRFRLELGWSLALGVGLALVGWSADAFLP